MVHPFDSSKGFDSFTNSEYEEGGEEFKEALSANGWEVVHIPAHRIEHEMPTTAEGLAAFDCVVISDVGANSFLLTPGVFKRSKAEANRLDALKGYVLAGGALLMVGGYMSFSGIDAKANYANSPLAEIMPVSIRTTDDRVEAPQGVKPEILVAHPALPGDRDWPALLGYNKTGRLEVGEVLVEVAGDPLIAVRQTGEGRTGVFTSDLAPHWAPPEFLSWPGYSEVWTCLISWLAKVGQASA